MAIHDRYLHARKLYRFGWNETKLLSIRFVIHHNTFLRFKCSASQNKKSNCIVTKNKQPDHALTCAVCRIVHYDLYAVQFGCDLLANNKR